MRRSRSPRRPSTGAKKHYHDVLIVDTAGRLAIDEAMMAEIRALHSRLAPVETLFVVDAMVGQDAVNTARAFGEALPLTGIVLTKLDGDARGGAALSVRQVTGKPIKFVGVGEKLAALEVFHPDRMAGRILGMGDIVALVEDAQRGVDMAEAEKLAKKVKSGARFDLEDFKSQLQQMNKMGGLGGLLEKLPAQFQQAAGKTDMGRAERDVKRMEGIINAMTPARTRETRTDQGEPQAAHRDRRRRAGAGSQSAAQAVRSDAGRHEDHAEGRHGEDDARDARDDPRHVTPGVDATTRRRPRGSHFDLRRTFARDGVRVAASVTVITAFADALSRNCATSRSARFVCANADYFTTIGPQPPRSTNRLEGVRMATNKRPTPAPKVSNGLTIRKVQRFGWIPDLPDQRDFLFAAPAPFQSNIPPSMDLRKQCPPVYDQGQLGSCTANAIAGAIEFDQIKAQQTEFTPSRLFIYYNERTIEGTIEDPIRGRRSATASRASRRSAPRPRPSGRTRSASSRHEAAGEGLHRREAACRQALPAADPGAGDAQGLPRIGLSVRLRLHLLRVVRGCGGREDRHAADAGERREGGRRPRRAVRRIRRQVADVPRAQLVGRDVGD